MIRFATVSDVPKMHDLFLAFGRAAYGIEADLEAVCAQIVSMIESPTDSAVFVYERDGTIEGLIAGLIVPRWFQPALHNCIELLWWVNPAERGVGVQLLEALESWSADHDAPLIMCTTGALEPERLRAFYEKRGYQLIEQSFERR